MKKIACALFAVALCGCNTTPPAPATQIVQVDKLVKVPCVAKKPDRPVYQFGKGAAPSEIEQGAILIADFEKAEQYGYAWEAATAGCMIVPSGTE